MDGVTLGGSTLPAAAGLDPRCSPVRLWLELTRGREREESEAMWWGQRDQAAILERLEVLGYDVGPGKTLNSEATPWLVGHTDAHLEGTLDTLGPPVEVKSMAGRFESWYPAQEAQLQTYIYLADEDMGLLARRIGHTLEVTEHVRDQRVIDLLLGLGETFMEYVQKDTPPPVSDHPDDRAALILLHPDAEPGRQTRASRYIVDTIKELRRQMEATKASKAREESLKALISEAMGTAEVLIGPDNEPLATWRNTTSRRFNTERFKTEHPDLYEDFREPSTTRTLRLA